MKRKPKENRLTEKLIVVKRELELKGNLLVMNPG